MEEKIKNLDDIIFMRKNKSYGAYTHRRNYKRYLFWAMVSATSLFVTGVSAPLIANYLDGYIDEGRRTVVIEDTLTRFKKQTETRIIPDLKKPVPKYKPFLVPKVVEDPEVDTDLSMQMDSVRNVRPADSLSSGPIQVVEDTTRIIDIPEPETFISVEEMPEFPGGEEGRVKYLAANVHYPEAAATVGIEGPVYVTFVVDQTGKVVEAEVLRGIGGGCDEEALRVLSEMPRWTPGRQGGKEVRVRFSMTIHFRLK